MIAFLSFLGVAILLTVEGRWLLALISWGSLTKSEEWALGFPLGAFVNALLFFAFTVLGVSLSGAAVFGGHLGIVVIVFAVSSRVATPSSPFDTPSLRLGLLRVTQRGVSRDFNFKKYLLPILLTLAVLIKLFYGISHAFLPSYSYDTVSQWNMRAKISSEDQAIAFDRDEVRGMSKPQYPILFHSLQILFNLPNREWHDPIANGATLVLSLTSFLAFFLLLRRLTGSFSALLITACIITIPILSIHLAQGYGDIHVLTYLLLGAALFLHFQRGDCAGSFDPTQDKLRAAPPLILSAIFVAASAWAKQEGLIFGVLPFLMILGVMLFDSSHSVFFERVRLGGRVEKRDSDTSRLAHPLKADSLARRELLLFGFFPTILLSIPWTLFLITKGLPLSPHGGGDLDVGWHGEGVSLALQSLFAGGSFGIHWYVVLGFLLYVFFERRRLSGGVEKSQGTASRLAHPASRDSLARREPFFILLWGGIAFFGALFIFLCTSNIQFLMNAQTFSRTMLLPLSLLILGTFLLFHYTERHDTEDGSRS